MKRFITLLLVLSLFLTLYACNSSKNDNSIVGEWTRQGQCYTFHKNGKLTINNEKYSYSTSKGKLTIKNSEISRSFYYVLSGHSLYIDALEYEKVTVDPAPKRELLHYIKKFFS